MLKKFWGTRFFSNFFNENAEKLSVSLGKFGDIASLLLFPIIGTSVWAFYFICVFAVFPNVKTEDTGLLGLVYPLVCMLSVALPTFFVRVFAKKYSAKTFAMFMILPAFSFILVACADKTLHMSLAGDLNPFALSWLALEAAALLIVLFYKPYSHYRAFQIVGSLFLFLCGAMVSFYSVSICYAVLVFWILSTAHILFRDKLLDCLEKR